MFGYLLIDGCDLDRNCAIQARLLGASKLPGKTIILGTLDLSDMTTESPETP